MAEYTLGSLAAEGKLTFSDGYRTKSSELSVTGYRILRAGDINGSALTMTSEDHVSQTYQRQIGEKAARVGDVVLTTKGTVGKTALVSHLREPAVYSPQLCFFRCNEEYLDTRFFYFWLSSPEFQRQVDAVKASSDMAPYLSLSELSKIRASFPTVDTQRRIGEVLGALDDKISLNRRSITSIKSLMQALYEKSVATTANLTSLATFVNGRNFTKSASQTGRIVVRIAELNSGLGSSTVRSEIAADESNVAEPGDILFAWSGSLTLARWTGDQALINQHIFKVLPVDGVPPWLAYQALSTQISDFRAIASGKATTMGHIRRQDLNVNVPVPATAQVRNLDSVFSPLWDEWLKTEQESHTLTQLRDTLLPALMDGRIRVKDAVRKVEEVL